MVISLPQQAQSFVTTSTSSSSLGYGFAVDARGSAKMLISGIDYVSDSEKETPNSQEADTDCYVGVGNAQELELVKFDSLNICLDIAILNLPDQPAVAGLPDAIVTAMAGQQPMIVSLNYGTEFSDSTMVDSALLPTRYFPAVMTTDTQMGGVYVALHPTHGTSIAPATPQPDGSTDQAEEMRSTWFFLEQMTRPAPIFVQPTDGDHSPKIVKYNMLTEDMEWIHTLETQEGKSLVAGMAVSQARNFLVIVGSATGTGPGVGAGSVSDGDWDGFLTVLDMNMGDLNTGNWNLTYNALHSTRIRTQKNIDDVVLDVCVSGDKAYVVGSTQGRFEGEINGGAFILKYDIDPLRLLWVHQIAGKSVGATHCAIDGETLYVGGSAPPGIELDERKVPKNEAVDTTHDIFVAKFNAETGVREFLRQIDSHRDDELIGMTITPSNQNLLLSANARDFATGETIIFTMDMDSEGNYDWEKLAPNIDPITGASIASSASDSNEEDNSDDWLVAVAIAVPVIILLAITCYYFACLSAAQVPLDYPDNPTHGNAAQDTELQIVGESATVV
ncbi:unnamed protein product [Cylindrotheca closterium]|uniref:Uncharacterized protein n=1 Tax=Cylindrotheca closterium TaxID=2856 RepID=A0AAD2JPL8_9STRA|nr:unnamed protein product [Cylindrotheca closterium]